MGFWNPGLESEGHFAQILSPGSLGSHSDLRGGNALPGLSEFDGAPGATQRHTAVPMQTDDALKSY